MNLALTLVRKNDYGRSEKQAEKLPKPPWSGFWKIIVWQKQVDVEDDNDDGHDGDDSDDANKIHDDVYADDDAADGDDDDVEDDDDGSGGKIRGRAKRGRRI